MHHYIQLWNFQTGYSDVAFPGRPAWGIMAPSRDVAAENGARRSGKAWRMPKLLVIQPIHEAGMALLEDRPDVAYEVVEDALPSLAAKLADVEAITVRTVPLPRQLLELAPRLKVVARHGVGYDNLDVAYLTERRIPLAVTANANAISVAEHAMFMLLHLAKAATAHDQATRQAGWPVRNRLLALDLAGRRLLIIGFGRIGSRVAKRALAFDMTVLVYDPYVPAERIIAAGCEPVADFRAILPTVDVLSLHAPLTAETRGLIGPAELASLPSHALLINTARGGMVDEAALAAALRGGQLAGAGLDVFEQEPPAEGHALFGLSNVVLSPHIAGVTQEAAQRMAIATMQNALAGLDGRLDPATVVNREVLST